MTSDGSAFRVRQQRLAIVNKREAVMKQVQNYPQTRNFASSPSTHAIRLNCC